MTANEAFRNRRRAQKEKKKDVYQRRKEFFQRISGKPLHKTPIGASEPGDGSVADEDES